MISVICTNSDADIIGSERKMVNHFQQEDMNVESYHVLSEKIKAKKSDITQLNAKVTATKKRKKKATKQQMLDVRDEEDTLKEMRQQHAQLEAERFEFLVTTRNSLVTEQLKDTMQSHVPRGQTLEVHCVSNYHYAALKGGAINGPRLPAETTGIPQLRANTLALMAPRLMKTLTHYSGFSLQAMLKDLQLWLHSASVDRRPEILELTKKPHANLSPVFEHRLVTFAKNIQAASDNVLMQAVSKPRKRHSSSWLRKGRNTLRLSWLLSERTVPMRPRCAPKSPGTRTSRSLLQIPWQDARLHSLKHGTYSPSSLNAA
jgi:hypothetical protein